MKRSNGARLAAALSAVFILAASGRECFPDSIELDNGNTLSGTVVSDTADEVVILVESGRVTVPRSRISSVSRDVMPADVPASAAKMADEGRFGEAVGLLLPFHRPVNPDRRAAEALDAVFGRWFESLIRSGRLSAARRAAERRLSLLGDGPRQALFADEMRRGRERTDALRAEATRLEAEGLFAEARSAWLEILRAEPLDRAEEAFGALSGVCSGRGKAMLAAGDFQGAANAFREALAWEPSSAARFETEAVQALAGMAAAPGGESRSGRAVRLVEEFLETYPEERALWALLARSEGSGAGGPFHRILSIRLPPGFRPGSAAGREGITELSGSMLGDAPESGPGCAGVSFPPGCAPILRESAIVHAARISRIWGQAVGVGAIRFDLRLVEADGGAPEGPPELAGSCSVFFSRGGARAEIGLRGETRRLAGEVLPHEIGHAFFEAASGARPGLPRWIHEGAAIWTGPAAVRAHSALMLSLYVAEGLAVPSEGLLGAKDFSGLAGAGRGGKARAETCAYLASFGLFDFLASLKGLRGMLGLCAEMEGMQPAMAICSFFGFQDVRALCRRWAGWLAETVPAPWESAAITDRFLGE